MNQVRTNLPSDNPFALMRSRSQSIPKYVKSYESANPSFAKPKYFTELEKLIRRRYPSLNSSELIRTSNFLEPIYERKGLLTDDEIDNAVKQIDVQSQLNKLPEIVSQKLTEIYNSLSAIERKSLLSGNIGERLGIEGVPESDLRDAVAGINMIAPSTIESSPQISASVSFPEVIQSSPIEQLPLEEETPITQEPPMKYEDYSEEVKTYLSKLRQLYPRLTPIEKAFVSKVNGPIHFMEKYPDIFGDINPRYLFNLDLNSFKEYINGSSKWGPKFDKKVFTQFLPKEKEQIQEEEVAKGSGKKKSEKKDKKKVVYYF